MKQGDFSTLAKHYHNRPAYSAYLLSKLLRCVNDENLPLSEFKVAEVGAGTAKLTKMLAKDFGLQVEAVEPNDEMRAEGIKDTKNLSINWHKGSGEDTTLKSQSANWLVMASSFHWTDPKKSLPEFARVLKGESLKKSEKSLNSGKNSHSSQGGGYGYFSIIYNPRHIVKGSIFDEIEEEIKNITPELTRVSSGSQNVKNWDEILVSTGDFTDCFFMECDYSEVWSKERYMGAWHSVNDIQVQAGEKKWQKILQMIESKIKNLDELVIPYKIRAWTARKA